MMHTVKYKIYYVISFLIFVALFSCADSKKVKEEIEINLFSDPNLNYENYTPKTTDKIISRTEYLSKLKGFWLGQCIANWTGLVTEMDKIGNIGDLKTGSFYTRNDWGKRDQPSIWGKGIPSDLSENIDFVFAKPDSIWGSDDDTDIEFMYQHLLYTNKISVLTGTQIRAGWLKHMKQEEENFLWVSNQKALDLMIEGYAPPDTSDPKYTTDSIYNNYYEMIDAQLTTEIFGFLHQLDPMWL